MIDVVCCKIEIYSLLRRELEETLMSGYLKNKANNQKSTKCQLIRKGYPNAW